MDASFFEAKHRSSIIFPLMSLTDVIGGCHNKKLDLWLQPRPISSMEFCLKLKTVAASLSPTTLVPLDEVVGQRLSKNAKT